MCRQSILQPSWSQSLALCLAFVNLLVGPMVWAQTPVRPYASLENARLVVQTGHGRSPAAISRAAFSEDGSLLATAAVSDLQIVLWHAGTGKQLRSFVGHSDRITGLRLNRTEGYLISASADGSVRKWDLRGGDEQGVLHRSPEAITAIDQARAADLIAFGSENGRITLKSIRDGADLKSISVKGLIGAIALDDSGRLLAASHENRVLVTGVAGSAVAYTVELPKTPRLVRFSPNAEFLLIVSTDGSLGRLRVASRQLEERLLPDFRVLGLSEDASKVVATDKDGLTSLVTIDSGKIRPFRKNLADFFAVFAPDGERVFAVSHEKQTASFFSSSTGLISSSIESSSRPASAMQLSHDGRYLLVGRTSQHADLWDLRLGKVVSRYLVRGNASVQAVAFAGGAPRTVWLGASSGEMNLWLQNGRAEVTMRRQQPFARLGPATDGIKELHATPKGDYLIVAPNSTAMQVRPYVYRFDEYGNIVGEGFFRSDQPIQKVFGFSRDGKLLATSRKSGGVSLWNGDDLAHAQTLKRASAALAANFSPSSERIAVAFTTGTIAVYKISNGKAVCETGGNTGSPPLSLTYTNDGALVAASFAGHTGVVVKVFNAQDCQLVGQFSPVPDATGTLIAIGDEKLLAMPSSAGFISVIDAGTGKDGARLFSLGDNWLIVSPTGHFDSSQLGEAAVAHWVLRDAPYQTVSLSDAGVSKYRPGLLGSIVRGEWLAPKGGAAIHDLDPGVAPKLVGIAYNQETATVDLSIDLTLAQGRLQPAVQELKVFRDRILVRRVRLEKSENAGLRLGADSNETLTMLDPLRFRLALRQIPLPTKRRQTVTAFEAYIEIKDVGKGPSTVASYHGSRNFDRTQGRAVVVSIGVNAYADRRFDLKYAVNDAKLVGQTLRTALVSSEQFSSVHSIVLTSERSDQTSFSEPRPDKKTIGNLFRVLSGEPSQDPAVIKILSDASLGDRGNAVIQPNDVLIIHYAGHGFVDRQGMFHLASTDFDGAGLASTAHEQTPALGVSAQELATWLDRTDAKHIVLIIDACHSASAFSQPGKAPGPFGLSGLLQLAYDKRLRILAGSQAAELSFELNELRHGLLSYTLTKAAERKVSTNHAINDLRMNEWLTFGLEEVSAVHAEYKKDPLAFAARHVSGSSARGTTVGSDLVQRPALYENGRYEDDIVLWPGFRRDRSIKADSHLGKAMELARSEKTDRAEEARELDEALDWYKEADDISGIALTYEVDADRNARIQNYKEAIKDLRLAQYHWARAGYAGERPRIWLSIAEMAIKSGESSYAMNALDVALNLARDISDWPVYVRALEAAANIYRRAGSPEIARSICESTREVPKDLRGRAVSTSMPEVACSD